MATDQEKLEAVYDVIRKMRCPSRYDSCKEATGCFGVGWPPEKLSIEEMVFQRKQAGFDPNED